MADLPARLAEIRARWIWITDQSIGEAQNTIEELGDTLEAALRVVEAARTFEDDATYIIEKSPNGMRRADMQKFLDALAPFTQRPEAGG